jgi:hypothetical protein
MDATALERGRDLIMRMALHLLYCKAFAVNVNKYQQYTDMYCIIFANMIKWRDRLETNRDMIDSVLLVCVLLYNKHTALAQTLSKYILPSHFTIGLNELSR